MSSIIVNSTHIIDKINNSTFQIDFERSVSLQDKNIALTSACYILVGEILQVPTIHFRIFGLTI